MNNRQASRRGRGRNNNSNNRNNNRGGGIDRDNRIDNRARGNAAQMLDKYKKMAHDAQVNDDRVNAEYYLQFADHYFRVNADAIARREEQRIARESQREDRDSQRSGGNDRRDRNQASGNDGDEERQSRAPRERQQRDTPDRASDDNSAPDNGAAPDKEKKPVRARRPRKTEAKPANGEASDTSGLDASVLPPAISTSDADDEPQAKPVRKRRTVKAKVAEEAANEDGSAA